MKHKDESEATRTVARTLNRFERCIENGYDLSCITQSDRRLWLEEIQKSVEYIDQFIDVIDALLEGDAMDEFITRFKAKE